MNSTYEQELGVISEVGNPLMWVCKIPRGKNHRVMMDEEAGDDDPVVGGRTRGGRLEVGDGGEFL